MQQTQNVSYEEDEHGSEPVDTDPTAIEAHVHLARTVRKWP